MSAPRRDEEATVTLRVLILREIPPDAVESLRDLPGNPELLFESDATALLTRIAADRPQVLVSDDGTLDAAAASHDLEVSLEREFSRAVRYRHPFAIVVIAADRLDALRDDHGAAAVSGYLAALEDALRRSLRQIDLLRRLESGVFVALLPETSSEGARVVAARLRTLAARLLFKPGGTSRPGLPIKSTASLGYADAPREEIPTARRLLEVAREAAAIAQREGGDRVGPPAA